MSHGWTRIRGAGFLSVCIRAHPWLIILAVARKIEQEIERLGALVDAPAAEALSALRKALGDRVSLVVAKAAKVAAARQFGQLIPDLLRAFDRLFDNPVERDPQCWGKIGIANALRDLDYHESAPYLRGSRHIQMEPVWGGQEDTAQPLRGACLLALIACTDLGRIEILRCLVDAITEPEAVVRGEAARAVAEMAGDEAALLLRFKARVGDDDPNVTGQVFDGIVRMEGAAGVPFLAAFLHARQEEARQEAALALGSSRLPAAVAELKRALADARDAGFRETLLRALSLSREPDALELLLDLVKTARLSEATAAVEALAIHRATPEVRDTVAEAVKDRPRELQEQFRKLFAE
jgi:HEAT repeat protein